MRGLKTYLESTIPSAPLAVFRIIFGFLMFASVVRFWALGWIEKLYIEPQFFFSYYGFEWVKPLGNWTYLLFALCGLSAFMVALGWKYRLATIMFFLSFTYIELMDKTTYLNHYYFVSLVSFLLIFLPAGGRFSIDAKNDSTKHYTRIPAWCVDALKVLISIVYGYAGLAKLNSDWLLNAMPLKIWLPTTDLPFLSHLFQFEWTIYAFAWAGAIYDLSIPFLLWNKRTRPVAFVLVVVFHGLTAALFPIGMFPYLMIAVSLLFFAPSFHENLLRRLSSFLKIHFPASGILTQNSPWQKTSLVAVALLLFLQLAVPLRPLLYDGELFWTEQGYRFSWRVMLMDKVGYAQFKVFDEQGKSFYIDNSAFLTPFQEKQMATQPDFMLEYAHFLGVQFAASEVRVDSYVALNGRPHMLYVNPEENLLGYPRNLSSKKWILPFSDEIKGL